MTPPRPLPAYRQVTQALRQRIAGGEWATGHVLPTELALAEVFHVNRSTVREGLRQLEQDGLLRREGKRLLVSIPRSADLANHQALTLQLRQVSLLDVYQVALVLEPLCAALAANRIDGPGLALLRDNLHHTEAILARGESPVDIDLAFQNTVADHCGNPALRLARAPISQLMHTGYAAIAPRLPQSGPRLMLAHQRVVDALARGDATAAEHWTRKHMLDYRRGCEVAGLDMASPLHAPRLLSTVKQAEGATTPR